MQNYQSTKNKRGFMHPISTIGQKFIDFARNNSPVIDMGCAYGNVVQAAFIAAIHAAHILSFLTGTELTAGLKKFYSWLRPEGKLFILCYTIFIKELTNELFQQEYQRRKTLNIEWPGYFKNHTDYVDIQGTDPFQFFLHVFEKEPLVCGLQQAGFEIKFAGYLDGPSNFAMDNTWFDGREYLGIVDI